MQEPRRVALSLLYEVFGRDALDLDIPSLRSLGLDLAQSLVCLMERDLNCPWTTSMGRLFDGISSIMGLRHISTFEGEAAIALEFKANSCLDAPSASPYRIPLTQEGRIESGWVADWHSLLKCIMDDILANKPLSLISQHFHLALIELIPQVRPCQVQTF